MPPQKKLTLLTLVIISLVFGGLIGFYVGKNSKQILNTDPRFDSLRIAPNNQIYTAQTAVIRGRIVGLNNGVATLTNQGSIQGDFQITDQVYVTRYDEKGVRYSTYESASSLDLNRDAIISLESLIVQTSDNVTYKVIAVEFPPVFN